MPPRKRCRYEAQQSQIAPGRGEVCESGPQQMPDAPEIAESHCPNCQLPFAILQVQTATWHLSECLEIDRNNHLECSKGINCDSTIVSHYLSQTHYTLARHRSEPAINVFRPPVTHRGPLKDDDKADQSVLQSVKTSLNSSPSSVRSDVKFVLTQTNNCKQAKITAFFTSNLQPRTSEPCPEVKVVTPAVHIRDKNCLVKAAGDSQNVSNHSVAKQCPKYKRLPDLPFVVDAFQYGHIPNVTAYFLSHFHSDHYGGLSSKFSKDIYCSQVTANLIKLKFRIPHAFIRPLLLNEPHFVYGVEVILIEANHCPGAVMFLFRYPDGRTILHTGDFRADAEMELNPVLLIPHVDFLYLDTTYCQPSYTFPTQGEVLDYVVHATRQHLIQWPRSLIVCGSYTIGKEKVFTAIAQALHMKIWAPSAKRQILRCLEDDVLKAALMEDPSNAAIHVLDMGQLTFEYLQEHLSKVSRKYTGVLAFKPTGWEYRPRGQKTASALLATVPRRHGKITIYGVPYSEHSSFSELKRFVQFLKPANIIPTVNVSGKKSVMQMEIIRSWMHTTVVLEQNECMALIRSHN